MRTLYVRIIVMTTAIMLISSIVGFIVTNIYYDHVLKEQNDAKVVSIANNAVDIFEQSKEEDIGNYLTTLSTLGYQFYLIDENGDGRLFGEPFRKYEMNQVMVDKVLQGGTYHGIKDYPWKLFITGFFDNELVNTVGIPIQVNGKTEALFVRQNTKLQFGEMRIFLAILLVLILVLSFILIILSTMFVVRPIKRLTEATKKIASGNFHLKLNVNRSDEIGRLAQDFTKMSEQLAKTEEKRQEFVSNVSHEIQSPLTSIQGFSKVLREEEISEDMRHHYSDIIYKESQRLSALSKQLLTLSFLDRGEGQEDCLVFDVAEQLRESVDLAEWQWREKELTIELDVRPMEYFGNGKLLRQVWLNLLTNGIRYTGQGGMIKIRNRIHKNNVIVSFTDNGIGIDAEHIPHLFERFYKVDKARTRTEDSTGLGLSIVKEIVEMHDGFIEVESKRNQGTTFTIYLPQK